MALVLLVMPLAQLAAQAQSRHKASRQKKEVKVETRADILYAELLPSTARVMFIDSVLATTSDFLKYIPMTRDIGTVASCGDYFKDNNKADGYVYVNEMGNKRYYSRVGTDSISRLYTQDKLGDTWGDEQQITDFGDEYEDISCPFMMGDGVTLYFSARGNNSVGGRDLFVTRYDTGSSRFYKPENVGLPFNSRDNDYYYIVDELNGLGWLVTDRRCGNDTVCVYTFMVPANRDVYDNIEEDKLNSLAALTSIRDTWFNDMEYGVAKATLDNVRSQISAGANVNSDIAFVINDDVTYHSVSDFRLAASRDKYNTLVSKRKTLDEDCEHLTLLRQKYSSADARTKQSIAGDILSLEKSVDKLRQEIRQDEKDIRNMENKAL